jgi:hypothetical protein
LVNLTNQITVRETLPARREKAIARRFSKEGEALALKIAAKSYNGGDKELEAMIADLRAGRTVRI